jgi:fibronectin-binding autotransporter adhesin
VGDVLDNGALGFNRTADLTYGGVISGTGSVGQAGTGTLTLAGTNTYSGGTTVNVGRTLAVSSDANLGAVSGGLTLDGGTLETTASFTLARPLILGDFDGTLQSDVGTNLVIAGTIDGPGMLTKAGPGILTFASTGSWSGGITVNDGTLRATQPLPGFVTISSDGTLDAATGVGSNLSNAGKVAIHGGDTTVGGSYSEDSVGTLAISLGSKLAVTGTATLNG